jgi:small-conductance mechanosensitive channel
MLVPQLPAGLGHCLPEGRGLTETTRQMWLRTSLPIVLNILFVVTMVVAELMIASSIAISPLIASAGTIVVAVGFDAQMLVRDVISGTFYLLVDAFPVGQWIASGSHKRLLKASIFVRSSSGIRAAISPYCPSANLGWSTT